MPLSNTNTSFALDLIPAYVVDLDARHLIEAVLAGYTDRLADLRSLAGRYSTFAEANPAPYTLVVVSVQTTAGPVVNRVLDIKGDTPVDPGAALDAWAAQQLGVAVGDIRTAVFGTDAYRTVSIDSVQLLASTLGATLYHPVIQGSPDLSRFSLATFFPRLKLRGTPAAFDVLARLYGFDEAKMTPLWSRLAPRNISDPGAEVNEQDFSAVSDTPPETGAEYEPQVKNDGPYYAWVSAPLSILSTDTNYVTRINDNNPFVRVVPALAVIRVPSAGTSQLTGGADGVFATADIGGGFTAYAADRGESFNGLPLVVAPLSGTTFQLGVTWPLSLVKYRSSFYDLALSSDHPETIPAAANADLKANPTLTPDGTATSPWTPWSGSIPRVQAPAGTWQVDTAALGAAASAVMASVADISAATRRARAMRFGVSARDTIGYTPYPGIVSGYGTASFVAGCVDDAAISITLDGSPVSVQATGTTVSFGSGLTSGTLNLATGSITASGHNFIARLPRTLECAATTGSTLDSARLYYDRPLEATPTSGTTQLQLSDDYPWLRPLVAGGASVAVDGFVPEYGDAIPVVVNTALCVRTTSQVNIRPVVRDYAAVGASRPFGYRVRATDDQLADTSYASRNGTQVSIIASGGFIFDSGRWIPALHSALLAWVPLADHVDETPVTVRVAAGSSLPTIDGVAQLDRRYTSAGWALRLSAGATVQLSCAAAVTAAALRVVSSSGTGVLVTTGGMSVTATPTAYSFDVGTTQQTITRPAGVHLLGFSQSAGSTLAFVGTTTISLAAVGTPSNHLTIGGVGATLQDLLVWRAEKSVNDILDAFNGRAAAAPLRPPAVLQSIHGKRYALQVNQVSGFCDPADTGRDFVQDNFGRVVRYAADGGYTGDPRFESLGLGQSSPAYTKVTLGLEGLEMTGDGKVVIIDTENSALPGAPRNFPSYPPLDGLNAIVGHFDTKAATSGVARASLVSTGSSVVYALSPVARMAGTRTINRATGALGAAFTTGTTLVANSYGTLVAGLGTAGTILQSPAAYLYLHEEPAATLDSFTAWINKSAYGIGLGKAALAVDGELLFSIATPLVAGYYAVDVASHNDGVLDAAFDGFDTDITLELANPVVVPAVLQPEAAGMSPSGTTRVSFALADSTGSNWVLRLRWFNARALPTKGQIRRLVIDGLSIKRLRSRVFSATLPPIEQITPPGAYVSRINSYGTQVSSAHESTVYAGTAVRPLANALTGSTSRRNEFHAGGLFQLPQPPAIPALTSVYYAASTLTPIGFDDIPDSIWVEEDGVTVPCMDTPLSGPVNVGDIVRFSGSATGGVGPLRYHARITSPGVTASLSSYDSIATWRATVGGTHQVEMRAIDQYGNYCTLSGSAAVVVVNPSPSLQITAIPSLLSRRTPFTLALAATTSAPITDSPIINWYKDGTATSTGNAASIYVERDCSVTATVTTNSGATTTMTLPFVTRQGRPPAVSLSEYPRQAKAAQPKRLAFRATVADPDNRGLVSSAWNFWDGVSVAGTLQSCGTGLYYAEITRQFGAGAQGQARFDFTVTDTAGRNGVAAAQVDLVFPSVPVIDSVSADSYTVLAGVRATFRCKAHSPLNLGLTTSWVFSNGMVAFGSVVSIDTAGYAGSAIGAVVSVTDSAGETVVADVRQVQIG